MEKIYSMHEYMQSVFLDIVNAELIQKGNSIFQSKQLILLHFTHNAVSEYWPRLNPHLLRCLCEINVNHILLYPLFIRMQQLTFSHTHKHF